MGILKDPKAQEAPGSTTKRRSLQPDFSNLGPLKPGGTVGFLNFRDGEQEKRKGSKGKKSKDDMDSDDDDDDSVTGKADDEEGKDDHFLSPDDIRFQGELAEGVRKIKVRLMINSALFSNFTDPRISSNVNIRLPRYLPTVKAMPRTPLLPAKPNHSRRICLQRRQSRLLSPAA